MNNTDNTLAEQIANRLRRAILRGTLLPGAQVKERDSAAELGVSRTPMREAIRILAQEGLIELRPARSPIVARPDVKSASDDVEVLLAVEQLASDLACSRATEAELEHISSLNRKMSEGFNTIDRLDYFELDMSFHSAIARASHNAQLAEIHKKYLARLWHLRFLAAMKRRNRSRVVAHHGAIVHALQSRDTTAARAAIMEHLGGLAHDIFIVIEEEMSSGAMPEDDKSEPAARAES